MESNNCQALHYGVEGGAGGGAGGDATVSTVTMGLCDRCLQPIDPTFHADKVEELIGTAKRTRGEHEEAAAALREAEAAAAAAATVGQCRLDR